MFRHMQTSSHDAAETALSFTDQREDVAVRVLEPCRFHPAAGEVHVALPGRSGQVVVVLEDHPLALEASHLRFHISNDPGGGRGLVRPCIPGLVDQHGRVSALEREHAFLRKFYEGTLGLRPVETQEEGVLSLKSGNSTMLVYESRYAGRNKATAATWVVGEDRKSVG